MNREQLMAVYYSADGTMRPREERDKLSAEIERQETAKRIEAKRAEREAASDPNRNQWSGYRAAAERAAEQAFLPGEKEVAERRLELAKKEEAKRSAEIAEQVRQAELQRHPLIVEARAYLAKHREAIGEERALQAEAAIIAHGDDVNRAHTEVAIQVLDGLKARHAEKVAAQRDAYSASLRAQADEAHASAAALQSGHEVTTFGGNNNENH